jgi:trehalose 6-phosphate phosphatase
VKARARRKSTATYAFDAWPEIIARLRRARHRAFFLDFDGTLVTIQRSPRVVRSSARVNRILERLERNPNLTVAIVSGRRTSDLRRLLPVRGLRYFGLHGGERDGRPVKLCKSSRLALAHAKREAEVRLGKLRGVWIEDKELSLCVHYRSAGEAAGRETGRILKKVSVPLRKSLHILGGKKIWEILPTEVPGKFAAVQAALARMPPGTAAVYIGDDETDEGVFSALKNQTTIRVGTNDGTRARYFLPAPSDVLRFLARIEREFRS